MTRTKYDCHSDVLDEKGIVRVIPEPFKQDPPCFYGFYTTDEFCMGCRLYWEGKASG